MLPQAGPSSALGDTICLLTSISWVGRLLPELVMQRVHCTLCPGRICSDPSPDVAKLLFGAPICATVQRFETPRIQLGSRSCLALSSRKNCSYLHNGLVRVLRLERAFVAQHLNFRWQRARKRICLTALRLRTAMRPSKCMRLRDAASGSTSIINASTDSCPYAY